MNYRQGFKRVMVTALVLIGLLGLATAFVPVSVSAAACGPGGTSGQVTANVSIPAAGEYVAWTRIKIPVGANPYYQLEISSSCYNIGGAQIPPNTLTWVNYENNNSSMLATFMFPAAGSYPIKLIGSGQGVQIDRIMFLKSGETCSSNGNTPTGNGSNCATTQPVVIAQPTTPTSPQASATVNPTMGTVPSGSTKPSSVSTGTVYSPGILLAAQADPGSVAKVEYLVGGRVVQTTDNPEGLDTTLLQDGTQRVTTRITYKDGRIATSTDNVTVNNPDNAMAGIRRWLRLQYKSLLTNIALLCLLGLALTVLSVWRAYRRQRGMIIVGMPQQTTGYFQPLRRLLRMLRATSGIWFAFMLSGVLIMGLSIFGGITVCIICR